MLAQLDNLEPILGELVEVELRKEIATLKMKTANWIPHKVNKIT